MLTSNDEVLQTLREIAQQRKEVRLINIYKGIPVAYDAQILNTGIDAVTLKVHPYQALCLWLENQTFIQSEMLPELVRASTVTVDLQQEIAALSNFEYVSGAAVRRGRDRIQPRNMIAVDVAVRNFRLKSELRDLSPGGMAIYLDAAYYDPEIFRNEEPIEVTFLLPAAGDDPERSITLHGLIRSITRDRVNRYRVGIRITAGEKLDSRLSQYMVDRQSEVMNEIEVLHESIIKLSGSEEEV